MSWIVIGEENGHIKLVSSSTEDGLLPRGSFLTIEDGPTKFILRVDKSAQTEPYSPSPLIVDMDLSALPQDQKCQNEIYAFPIKYLSEREDGKIDYIRPQKKARRSNQEEVNIALEVLGTGPEVFIASIHAGQNQLLVDDEGNYIKARLPESMFFHQTLICGKTGSGKTVSTKYLAQYFVEKLEGAVLAINVKDTDFLRMHEPTRTRNETALEEWDVLGGVAHGIKNSVVYYPANKSIEAYKNPNLQLDTSYFRPITLSVKEIEPEALIGLLEGISDAGALNLPDIFRLWQKQKRDGKEDYAFSDFVNDFADAGDDTLVFQSMNVRGDRLTVPLHPATYRNVLTALVNAVTFFDNPGAEVISENTVLEPAKLSVIDVGNDGLRFGSIMLRHLLKKIVSAKSLQEKKMPVLIIIDEVHNFYKSDASQDALGDLDTICRQGRSQEIGVVFSSQNANDIPKGLDSVINTKIFFKSDPGTVKSQIFKVTGDELEGMERGYAVASIHDMSKLKILKFPLAYAGVIEKEQEE